MARAKQTARADARRRTRVASRPVDATEIDGADEASSGADGAAIASSNASARGRGEIPKRPGLGQVFGSFGSAYRRANVREDIALLPSLVRSRGFLAAIGMVLLGAIIFAIFPGYSGSSLAFQFLTFPPALAPIFVAGFFAPRGSYLLGLLVGLFDAVIYSIWLIAALPTLGAAATPDQIGLYIATAVFWSAVTGIIFGAGAAWYRRFLQSTNPSRRGAAGGRGQSGRGGASRSARTTRPASATTGRRRY